MLQSCCYLLFFCAVLQELRSVNPRETATAPVSVWVHSMHKRLHGDIGGGVAPHGAILFEMHSNIPFPLTCMVMRATH